MSSARLPGKVLREIAGKPLLAHVLDRVRAVANADLVVLATSTEPSDDPVAELARALGVPVHRGPLDDVARRFLGAVDEHGLDACARVCADSPLIDPAVVEAAIADFRRGDVDLVTNTYPQRTAPHGQSVEVISADALRTAIERQRRKADREHVTPYLYSHPNVFRIRNFMPEGDAWAESTAVDLEEDLARVEAILLESVRSGSQLRTSDLLRLAGQDAA